MLLSGGTTSLIGAPEPGLTPGDLTAIYGLLLGSGLDITAMNRIRKRFARWGGGKLARGAGAGPGPGLRRLRRHRRRPRLDRFGALRARSSHCRGGSRRARVAGLWDRFPTAARRLLAAAEAGETPETPKPGDRTFTRVTHELVASNRLALEAAAARAAGLGLAPGIAEAPFAGEAAASGRTGRRWSKIATAAKSRNRSRARTRRCFIWGGETTVTLGASPGVGGRCQELALAAARVLGGARRPRAARRGDRRPGRSHRCRRRASWMAAPGAAIVAGGRDPRATSPRHDAYAALDAAGALLRPGLTGTNVMDIVIGVSS